METIYIPHLLKSPQRKQDIVIDCFIPDLDSLTPVRGKMTLRHGGTFLEVLAVAETIITLTCDRCLKQYNFKLIVDTTEIIWLDKEVEQDKEHPLEREVALEDLAESLPSNGHFDLQIWIYEQMCLAMPIKQICSYDCHQPLISQEPLQKGLLDSRWSVLESLRKDLSADKISENL